MKPEILHITALVNKYLNNSISELESRELFSFLQQNTIENIPELEALIKEVYTQSFTEKKQLSQEGSQQILDKLLSSIQNTSALKNEAAVIIPMHRKPLLRRRWIGYAAASVIFIMIAGALFYLYSGKSKTTSGNNNIDQYAKHDIAPGGNRAILKLASGQQIVLDSVQGNIVQNGGLTVNNSNGLLGYDGNANTVEYNTVSTPRGGKYNVVLPDGTKVWLNAASSISFPTAFVGDERNVSITGEAYFEVAKNAQKPFKVQVNNMEVQVLGTHFNINAYTDEASIKTTLLEGSVKVSYQSPVSTITGKQNNPFIMLNPGQQARVEGEQISLVNAVDTEMEMAWKNGIFYFKNADLKTVMRGLARWYDLDVHYSGTVSNEQFEGKVPMDAMLSDVLHILEENKIHFLLEGKKITVLPYK